MVKNKTGLMKYEAESIILKMTKTVPNNNNTMEDTEHLEKLHNDTYIQKRRQSLQQKF